MNKEKNPTDKHIILQYIEGDNSLMPLLVQRYHKLFCEKAYWIVKDKEAAKDIAQESWITIMDKLPALRNVDSFRSWALRIVYTKAIDRVNNRKKQIEKAELASNYSANTSLDHQLKLESELLKAIQQLPKNKQDIIRLFYAENYSINEISSFLKIPKGTVKSRLFQAREKLKSLIKK